MQTKSCACGGIGGLSARFFILHSSFFIKNVCVFLNKNVAKRAGANTIFNVAAKKLKLAFWQSFIRAIPFARFFVFYAAGQFLPLSLF
ncbi:MAG: hypothetical protein IKS15_02910 [Opitutales bacterium]|nr:hypothetical protein [Opitutales bacterium]